MKYTVVFEPEEDGGYHAFVPALQGCHSQGDTLDEAAENIREAMELYVESLRAAGEPLPEERTRVETVEVAA